MRAVQINRFGGPEVLAVVDTPTPTPGPGQVLVQVRAAGINFAETLMRQNRYALTPELPAILGTEAVGTIRELGEGVNGLLPGARVAAPLFAGGSFFGGYADHVVIDRELVVPLPDALSFERATALMVQALTALFLTKQAPPKGKTVLVNAAAGGVGSLLVQLVRRAGAKGVIAAASTKEKLEFARRLGADAGVDYTRARLGRTGPRRKRRRRARPHLRVRRRRCDQASLEALAPLGEIVVYGALNIQDFQLGVPELLRLVFNNQSVAGFALVPLLTPESLRAGLSELFELAVDGRLEVTIGGTYALERAGEAHRALETRRTTGKLVLVPSD